MRGIWLTLAEIPLIVGALFAFRLALAAGEAFGAEPMVPGRNHHQAWETARDCSVYRTLSTRTSSQVERVRAEMDEYREKLRDKRRDLEACASENGILSLVSDRDETMLAELCSEDYASWMHLGYRLEVIRQDLQVANEELKWLKRRVASGCGSLPGIRSAGTTPSTGGGKAEAVRTVSPSRPQRARRVASADLGRVAALTGSHAGEKRTERARRPVRPVPLLPGVLPGPSALRELPQ